MASGPGFPAAKDLRARPFRSIQYLGNKSRVLPAILSAVSEFRTPSRPRVLDLFSGSGTVSAALSEFGPVTAVDIQEYARVLASAAVLPDASGTDTVLERARWEYDSAVEDPSIAKLLAEEDRVLADRDWEALGQIAEHGSLAADRMRSSSATPTMVREASLSLADSAQQYVLFQHYGGVYFSYRQSLELDSLRIAAHALDARERDTAVASVLAVASEVVTSVGSHFAQPPNVRTRNGTLKLPSVTAIARQRSVSAYAIYAKWSARYEALQRTPHAHRAVRAEVSTFLDGVGSDVGCAYADPPYTREHYSRFYHVLETIAANNGQPGISTIVRNGELEPSKGLYATDRFQSGFSIVSRAQFELDAVAEKLATAGIPLVLSYSPVPATEKPRQRVMAISEIMEVLNLRFREVQVREIDGVKHSRFNARALNAGRIDAPQEVLFVGLV